ncbi:MAG: serine/threonine protein kinase [Maioricimonas sp. JB045]
MATVPKASTPHHDGPSALDRTPVQSTESLQRSQALSVTTRDAPGPVPGYETLRCLGTGSYGSVWLARELKTGKQVAIKFYTHRRGLDWSLLSREVEKLAVLYTSRNIVGLLDVGWDHDPPYFVMEFLENGSLADLLAMERPSVSTTVEITRAVARALIHAHGSGILHCDLKPANVLIDGNHEARLGDFGQSRLSTEQSPALGTMFYMAPEQADLEAVPDARWDVYALGALMYHMLTGAPPHRTPENEQKLTAADSLEERLAIYRTLILEGERPRAHRDAVGIDTRLADIVDGCLHPDPAQRYPNAQVVMDLLDQREAARAKRPLMLLGILGPIFFLLAMYWIAQLSVPRLLDKAQENLVQRALESDAVSAKILAESIQQELRIRREQLEELADRPEMRELIAASATCNTDQLVDWVTNPEAGPKRESYEWLTRIKTTTDRRLDSVQRTRDDSWFVTDAAGRQIFRLPVDDTIGKAFHWRDYFHDLGLELPEDTELSEVQPRRTPGVSQAFLSHATYRYMVAIAVPVWDEQGEEVIGVLARTLHLTNLLTQWEERIRGDDRDDDRFLALADLRGDFVRLLDHEWIDPDHMAELSDSELDSPESRLALAPELADIITSRDRCGDYHDPVAALDPRFDGTWLAAFAPIPEAGWVAIVQERRDTVLQPVGDLYDVIFRAAFWAILVFSILLAVLWYLLQRASH